MKSPVTIRGMIAKPKSNGGFPRSRAGQLVPGYTRSAEFTVCHRSQPLGVEPGKSDLPKLLTIDVDRVL